MLTLFESRFARVVAVCAVLATGVLMTACTEEPRPAVAVARPSFLLVSLPSLGTASWRCGEREGSYGLAFRVFEAHATTDLRLLSAGRVIRAVTVDPGESYRFPVLGRTQRLELAQGTGAGTLGATVIVRFDQTPVVSHCYAYSPPKLTVRVTPRH
jgi:hypothetical protein